MTGATIPCVVATATRCAVGLTSESAAAAIRAGISMVGESADLTDARGEPAHCAWEPSLPQGLPAVGRISRLARAGLFDLAGELRALGALPSELVVLLALPEPRPGFAETDARSVAHDLSAAAIEGVRSVKVHGAASGHASGILALREAAALISAGRAEMVVVGGADSYIDAATMAWLDDDFRLARPGIRSGLPPGEAVAMVAVASPDFCARIGRVGAARIRGVAVAEETRDPKSDTGLLGEALGAVVAEVTAPLAARGDVVHDCYGDINGELSRSHDWGFALLRNAERFRDGTDYVTFAGECGDIGAATGLFGCILAIEAWRGDLADGGNALVWAGSWGGLRGGVLLERGGG